MSERAMPHVVVHLHAAALRPLRLLVYTPLVFEQKTALKRLYSFADCIVLLYPMLEHLIYVCGTDLLLRGGAEVLCT